MSRTDTLNESQVSGSTSYPFPKHQFLLRLILSITFMFSLLSSTDSHQDQKTSRRNTDLTDRHYSRDNYTLKIDWIVYCRSNSLFKIQNANLLHYLGVWKGFAKVEEFAKAIFSSYSRTPLGEISINLLLQNNCYLFCWVSLLITEVKRKNISAHSKRI